MSSAFRILAGKTASKALSNSVIIANPLAGLMIGIVATVAVQSSSTSTSIIVSMVGAGGLWPRIVNWFTLISLIIARTFCYFQVIEVKEAIPIIMGANLGTSITSTLVSLAQMVTATHAYLKLVY